MPGVEQGHPALKLAGAVFAAATRFVQEQPWQQHEQCPRGDPLWGIMLWVSVISSHEVRQDLSLYPCICTSDWGRHGTHCAGPNAELFVKHNPSQVTPTVGQVRYAMLRHNALGLRLLRLWGKSWFPWLLLGLGFRRRS